MKHHVLLTGATGFVGKVVLAELLRRRTELRIDRITLLIRSKTARGKLVAPQQRFTEHIAQSPALLKLGELDIDWQQHVDVITADLEQSDCGMTISDRTALQCRVTRIIHCAASVEFDLPIKQAAAANIVSALNVLEFARDCTSLTGMVSVSTAYVSVWRAGPITETLAPLPRPAEELFAAIQHNTHTESALLKDSGHPNTYTYTKCLAEHLLCERRGNVPLAIVRPSIICAAWHRPFPGWIDSTAAFAGCLLFTGLGIVKAWHADPAVRLDVVPVDVVANRILQSAFASGFPTQHQPVPIRFATMGIQNAMRVDMSALSTAQYFRERPGAKSVPQLFIGKTEHGFYKADFKHRVLPLQILRAWYAVTWRHTLRRRIKKVDRKIRYLNAAFYYFTHHTFDFQSQVPIDVRVDVPGFSPTQYIDVVNRGIYRHLLKLDETESVLAGKAHNDARSDLRWMTEKPHGTLAIRLLGVVFRKALRRCTSKVTFDRDSFERAVAAAPPNALLVLAPSHRSYFDFLLTSYLCFQHPELGIPVPHIAAAEEFSRIPLVGRFLKQTQAFYIRRGVGKAAPELGAELQQLAARSAALMFFIEGQRSRARRMLPPKRGLLRGLQGTGRTFTVLPIALSYEHVPEQAAFDRELRGGPRAKMSFGAILKWSLRLLRRQVSLGHVHVACGTPLLLNKATDVQELAHDITSQLQRATVITRFHLRTFLAHANLAHIDEQWLASAIEQRGGRVLDSNTPAPKTLSLGLQQNLQNQWMHWFYADALALFPNDLNIHHHIAQHGWTEFNWPEAKPETGARDRKIDARVELVVRKLFHPIHRDYALVKQHLSNNTPHTATLTANELVCAHPDAYLPLVEDALDAHGRTSPEEIVRRSYLTPASERAATTNS